MGIKKDGKGDGELRSEEGSSNVSQGMLTLEIQTLRDTDSTSSAVLAITSAGSTHSLSETSEVFPAQRYTG